jgi:hypothetical protein
MSFRFCANARVDCERGLSLPSRLIGRPMTSPTTFCAVIISASAALSFWNLVRRISKAGLANDQPASHSAVPIVLVPTSRPISRPPFGSASRNCAGETVIIA